MNTLDPKTIVALVLLAVRRYKIVAVVTFFLILAPVVAVGLFKKPMYMAKATVIVKQNNYSTSSLGNHVYTPRSLGIQLTIMKSQYLASKVVSALPERTIRDLEENSEYTDYQAKIINLIRTTLGKPPIVVNPMDRASAELRNARMEFKGLGPGGIIQIGGESSDPHVALDLVNTYMDVFKDISSHFAIEQQADLDKSLSLQILNAQSLLRKSEQDLLAFQNKVQKKGTGKGRVVDASSYLSQESSLLSNLRQKRRVLLLTETENHPDVVAVTQMIDEIEKKIGKLQNISQDAGGHVDVSGSAWESFLESNIKMDRDLLAELEEERSSSRIIADSNLENLVVIDPPILPMKPEMTKGFKIMAAGVVMAFGGSIGVPFLLVFFRKPVQGESNLKKLMGYVNFGNIPRVPSRYVPVYDGVKLLRVDQSIDKEIFWVFKKEFESMFFRIKNMLKLHQGRVIMITSASPEDGKSTTSMNLAITMSSLGYKTILIDSDTIRGRLQKSLQVENSYTAQDFLLDGGGNPPRINWENGTLAVISLGKEGGDFWRNHPEPSLAKWFEFLRFQSDYVLIDTPPIMASTDLLGVSSLIDGVLIVVRNNVTTEHDLLRVESILKDHSFEILGTVLNDSKSPHIQYSYGYTEGESKKKTKAGKREAKARDIA